MNEKSQYLYARELAEMYDISKQTLIFYDKINLLKPALLAVMVIECILSSSSLFWGLFLI